HGLCHPVRHGPVGRDAVAGAGLEAQFQLTSTGGQAVGVVDRLCPVPGGGQGGKKGGHSCPWCIPRLLSRPVSRCPARAKVCQEPRESTICTFPPAGTSLLLG